MPEIRQRNGMRKFTLNKTGHNLLTVQLAGAMSLKDFQADGWDIDGIFLCPKALIT
jgi:hypothetical protein